MMQLDKREYLTKNPYEALMQQTFLKYTSKVSY